MFVLQMTIFYLQQENPFRYKVFFILILDKSVVVQYLYKTDLDENICIWYEIW